ncbi:putative LuxR family transcriptional regulator [Gordonia araii NBRC 100433]|uniref:Putative LuxR family transcriptional regulator n=1 Tax=Gordonia araii NBRC 100433 TaxID=1073574 RepID=G7H724_9ACTN|nr:putative LuxR family transcriptional regulator [Gordonia araii NBRC 100433]
MLGVGPQTLGGLDVRFAVPEFAGLLHRNRLDDTLADAVENHRVTTLTAPSGYGKTVAAAEWARRSGDVVAWVSLNRYDDDPAALSEGIATTLRRTAWGMDRDDVLAELAVVNEASVAALHAAICSAVRLAEVRLVLVVDDMHLAGGGVIDSVLGALVEQGPQNLRLVLLGRDPDQLRISSQVLAGDAIRLDSSSLLFTPEEIGAVAQDFGWTTVDTEAVAERTGGWAAAVRLAMLMSTSEANSLSSRPPARTDDLLLSIIADDVLDSLPKDLAAFVLDATTVSDIDEHLAIGLTGRDDALTVLERCRRRGLFLERFGDGAVQQYRWHDVFASRCRQLVALRDAGHSRGLHRRAAELLADKDPLRAVDEALVAGDPELACRILVDSWVLLLAGRAEESPDRVIARLPEPFATRPDVLAVTACAVDMAGRRTEGQALLDSIERTGPRSHEDAGDSWRGALTNACARLFLCDKRTELIEALGAAHEHLAHARSLGPARYAAVQLLLGRIHLTLRYEVPEGISLLKSAEWHAKEAGEPTLCRRAAGLLSFCYAFTGDFEAAREVLARIQSVEGTTDDWSTQLGVPEVTARGWIAYWTGDFATAREAFGKAIDSRTEAAGFSSIARQYLATIAAIDGGPRDRRDAVAVVRQIPDREVRGVPWELYRTVAFAKLAEADGDHERAGSLVRSIRNDLREAPAAATAAVELIRRHVGKHAAAAIVKQLAPLPMAHYVRASLLVTSALIHRSDGDYGAAHEVLERALDVAAPTGVTRPFLEPDPALADLLAEHSRWGTNHTSFIADLRAPAHAVDGLTLREQQIVGFLRTSMTMTEIAAELGLSVNTIKTHTRMLYRKLGVGNRRDAVAAVANRR